MKNTITAEALNAMLTWNAILTHAADYESEAVWWIALGAAYDTCCELGFAYPGDTLREMGMIA